MVLFLDSEGAKRIHEVTKEITETGGNLGICEGPYFYGEYTVFDVINSDQITVLSFDTLDKAEEQKMFILSGKLPYDLQEIDSYAFTK